VQQKFTTSERRAVFGLSAIYGLRMFGLFLILPVLAIYADKLEGSTPFLVGMALGAYGIAQAILQIPFGLLSDKFGRKRIITIGLVIFAFGSLIAGMADNVYLMIIGRVLQGSGAIAAAVLALTADLTRENQRSKAMAVIGMSIGGSFMLAFILSSPLVSMFGFSGIFYVTALMAILAIFALWFYVPTQAPKASRDVKFVVSDFWALLKHPQLMRLNFGIFALHCILTALFVVIPLLLVNRAELASKEHWKMYVPVMLASILLMAPMIMASTKTHLVMRIFLMAICLLMLAQLLLFVSALDNVFSIALCLLVFFIGFNALEALLPSLITRVSPAANKGTAVGIYNTFQFSGVFVGGAVAGYLMGTSGENMVFVFCGVLLIIWASLVIFSPAIALYDSKLIKLKQNLGQQTKEIDQIYANLLALDGVKDVTIIQEESIAYLKVDKAQLVVSELNNFDFVEND